MMFTCALFDVIQSLQNASSYCVGEMRPVFCGNFDFEARQSDLERLFRKYGKVERVDMKSGNFSLFLVILSLDCLCFVVTLLWTC